MPNMHTIDPQALDPLIISVKQKRRSDLPQLKQIFADVESYIQQEVSKIKTLQEQGEPVIPIIEYAASVKSAPDSAPENYEINYQNRATKADLSPLGRQQMGIAPW